VMLSLTMLASAEEKDRRLLIGCFLRHTIQFSVLCVSVSCLSVCCSDCILSISSLLN